ncbi:hypothetical protein GGG16DRAFT_86592, partial [Schizophyllum commune]
VLTGRPAVRRLLGLTGPPSLSLGDTLEFFDIMLACTRRGCCHPELSTCVLPAYRGGACLLLPEFLHPSLFLKLVRSSTV